MQPTFIFDPEVRNGFAECHGSTLAPVAGGWLVAFFAGTCERHPDTAIWACRQSGGKWEKPQVAAKISDEAHWNPVLFKAGGLTRLFFKVGKEIETWETWFADYDEVKDGWTEPRRLCSGEDGAGGRGPVRSRPIILANGDWLAPGSHEKVVGYTFKLAPSGAIYKAPEGIWNAFVDRSPDDGRTWERSEYIPYDRDAWGEKGGIIQPTLWEQPEGQVNMFIRSTQGCLFRSVSSDNGKTWAEAAPTEVPNPNSAVDVALLDGKLLVLAYNPVSGNWIRRSPLSLAFSIDCGQTLTEPWNVIGGTGSFSYPSLYPVPGGVAMTYTWNRRCICFCRLSVLYKDIVDGVPAMDVSESG